MGVTYFYSDVLTGKRTTPATVANGYIKLTKDLAGAVVFNPGFKSPEPGWLNTSAAAAVDAASGLITDACSSICITCKRVVSATYPTSQAFLTSVKGELAGAEVGKQKTRTLQGEVTPFSPVLFKEGDGPGGFNALMAYHASNTILIGFTTSSATLSEVDTLIIDVMSAAVPSRRSRVRRGVCRTQTTGFGARWRGLDCNHQRRCENSDP